MKNPKFEFATPTVVQMLNVNTRKELRGDQHVQAVDLSFKSDFPNTILDELFQPGLREAMYYSAADESGQERIEGVPDTLPNLRFSRLNAGRFGWGGKDKLVGYLLRMEFGLGDAISNIELELCKVSSRAFEAKEGGTVTVFWKVQNASDRLDLETCGKLVLLGGEEVTMTLTAPVVAMDNEPGDEDKPENPFANPDPEPLADDTQTGPMFPVTPEAALVGSVGGVA